MATTKMRPGPYETSFEGSYPIRGSEWQAVKRVSFEEITRFDQSLTWDSINYVWKGTQEIRIANAMGGTEDEVVWLGVCDSVQEQQ